MGSRLRLVHIALQIAQADAMRDRLAAPAMHHRAWMSDRLGGLLFAVLHAPVPATAEK